MPLDLSGIPPLPEREAEPVVAEVAGQVTERSIAAAMAGSDLGSRLRRVIDGPHAGLREWDDKRWASCPDRLPPALCGAVKRLVASSIESRAIPASQAGTLERASAIRGIAEMAFAHKSLHIAADSIDRAWMLNTPNGTIDLRTMTIGPHRPEDWNVSITGAPWVPGATSPWWSLIQGHIEACDPGGFLQRYVGASACGLPADRKLGVMVDTGNSGKTALFTALGLALGDYCTHIPAEALTAGGGRGAHGMELQHGVSSARLAFAAEVGQELNWELLKALSGGDARMVKRLHGRASVVKPRVHLLLSTNKEPAPPSDDEAAIDRLAIVRMQPVAEPDTRLKQVLAADCQDRRDLLTAALGWVVEGARLFQAEGYGSAETVVATTDPEGIAAWWHSGTAAGWVAPGKGWTPAREVLDHAAQWLAGQGADMDTDNAAGRFLRRRLGCQRMGAANVLHYRVKLGSPT
jgi:putative DNA primase/helicase